MTQSRVVQIQESGGDFTLAHREVPSARRGPEVTRPTESPVVAALTWTRMGAV